MLKVAIVGAGIHGSSVALALARRGHKVTVYEQFALAHDRGSSHGTSRIVRRAYPDAFYTEIMQEAYPLWHELEESSGRKLLYECGLLYFGNRDDGNIQSVVRSLESLGVDHRIVDRAGIPSIFPDLILDRSEIGIFTPEAGWVHAGLAIQSIQELAKSRGVEFKEQRVNDLGPLKREFDRVILCQGPWAAQFLKLPVLVTLQTFAYIVGDHPGPVWIEEGPHSLYGFPSEPWGGGLKTGVHYKDVPFDPENSLRSPADGAIDLIEDFAWRRFGHDNPRAKNAKACLYTNTRNEDFLLGQLDDKVLFVSACSGHGFKFGLWIGQVMADLAEGTKKPRDFERFFWESQETKE